MNDSSAEPAVNASSQSNAVENQPWTSDSSDLLPVDDESAIPRLSAAKSLPLQDLPPSMDLSCSYQALRTPREARGRGSSTFFESGAGDRVSFTPSYGGIFSLDGDGPYEEGDRASHASRFLTDAEAIVAADPAKTRESFVDLDQHTGAGEWHERPVPLILRMLGVDRNAGLSTEEALKRLERDGRNALEAEKKTPLAILFLLQFTNLIIALLMAAALASIALQEFVEGVAIIAIVTLNAVIATIQERNASNALDALQKMTSPQCIVLRDGRQSQIPSDQLVVGDIVVLATGDIVPADLRLLTSADLKVNEMILTGESEDVLKKFDGDTAKSDKLTAINMVFSSTSVATGHATGVVVATGMQTRVGSIAALLKGGSSSDGNKKNGVSRFMDKYQPKMTPLQHALHRLGVIMGTVVLGICVIVFAVGMIRGNEDPKNPTRPIWLTMVMVAVSLAVSAVPEGLPMVVTICLSTGTADMVKQHVLVRKLAAVESLGASSVICTDKTGTLTEGKMTAVKMWGNGFEYDITGTGFTPSGDILCSGVSQMKSNVQVRATLLSAVLCSNTTLQKDEDDEGRTFWIPLGNSSEAPLVVAAAKAGIWRDQAMSNYQRVTEIPFSSSRKMMITVNEVPLHFANLRLSEATRFVANVKGAPNYILQNCTQLVEMDGTISSMSPRDRNDILEAVDRLSSQALRVLAVAIRPMTTVPLSTGEDDVDRKFEALCKPLVFVGLVASIDPPRQGVKDSIQKARDASIRTVMITGDYLQTAVAIAKNIDLIATDADSNEEAVDCTTLRPHHDQYLPDHEIDEITSRCSVFARAKPEDKIEIVKSLQRQGHVAAMTGDGVNDAPALKEADIGVAMGISGTAVAKGASDLILTDDNFCSIVSAVEKGREIYGNIQRFVCFLLSTNFGEITLIFCATAIGMPTPLEPLQILVLNLFADGMAAVALSLEKGDGSAMKERPRPRKQQIVHGRLWVLVLSNAALIGVGALIVFILGLNWNFQKVILSDITSGINTDLGEEEYNNVICRRWEGFGNGWRDFSNCAAKFSNGTYRFSEEIRTQSYYEDKNLVCYGRDYECVSEGISRSQTMAFVYITTMEMLRAYTARSFTKSVFKDMFSNKWMQMAAIGSLTLTLSVTNIPVIMDDLFGFAYIEWGEWIVAMCAALLMVAFGESLKFLYRRRDRKKLLWQNVQDSLSDAMLEIRTLRNYVERLEGRLGTDISELRHSKNRQSSSSTTSSSGSQDK